MKKALFVATIYGFLNSIETNNMRLLQDMGCEVHCMANPYQDQDPAKARVETPNIDAIGGIIKHDWVCARSPYDKNNIIALKQLKSLLDSTHFDIVHCHTPMGGVLARIACAPYRKKGLKVIYTAHGFHFFKGAPRKNWLVYYPIEKELSRVTDTLVTITREDYALARGSFFAGRTSYVPGVGVDLEKFRDVAIDRDAKRREMGIVPSDILLLSVGELNTNKNHQVVIQALGRLSNPRIHYVIAGTGDQADSLQKLAEECGVNLHLLGYRDDVPELLKAADIYALPSLREGLNVSLMEAMASGLPCICGKIRGNVDLIDNGCGGTLFDPTDVASCANALEAMLEMPAEKRKAYGAYNSGKIARFDRKSVEKMMREIYQNASN